MAASSGGGLFAPSLTKLFPTLNVDQQRAMDNFRATLASSGTTPLFGGGSGQGLLISPSLAPAVADGGGGLLPTGNSGSYLSIDPFAQSPQGSGFLSGLPAVPSLTGLDTSFTDSGGELASGLSTPSGADSSTTLELSSDLGGTATTTLDNVIDAGELSASAFTAAKKGSVSFYNTILDDLVDFFIRSGVFIVGAVMLAAAAYAFTREK